MMSKSTLAPSSAIGPKMPLSRLVLNLITVGMEHSFEKILDACVEHKISMISPWQSHYASIGADRAARLLQDRSIGVSTVCRMSGFGAADSPLAWKIALQDAHDVINEAATLRAQSVTVIGGGLPSNSRNIVSTRRRIVDGLTQVLPTARDAGVLLAIEPLHPMVAAERGSINSIAQACAIARELGEGTGVMIDAYNTWWDPTLAQSIANSEGLIAGFQVADWLVPTSDLAFDRGMPGDGVIDLRGMRAMIEGAGYHGSVEIELLSGRWSTQSLTDVLSTVVSRFEEYC